MLILNICIPSQSEQSRQNLKRHTNDIELALSRTNNFRETFLPEVIRIDSPNFKENKSEKYEFFELKGAKEGSSKKSKPSIMGSRKKQKKIQYPKKQDVKKENSAKNKISKGRGMFRKPTYIVKQDDKDVTRMIDITKNISLVLENLLKDYDSTQRPGLTMEKPTTITSNVLVRSMGPISELDMEYSMECYFRQAWHDARLTFESEIDELSLSIKTLDGIWKPDTFFYNGKRSYLHTITMPNKFFRLKKDGSISYSMRLTIKARCPMELRNFPLDYQFCPLVIGSYAYSASDLVYQWDVDNGVKFLPGVELSQFDLISSPIRNITIHRKQGEFSVLEVIFNLRRNSGYFLIQVYVPCILIVVLSWVSFWLNREATADRVSLGITAVLTVATISVDSRTNLPKVHYATALDWYLLMSFGYCMCTLLECAGVHFFTKIGGGEGLLEDDSLDFCDTSSSSENEESALEDKDRVSEKQRYFKARQRTAINCSTRPVLYNQKCYNHHSRTEIRLRRKTRPAAPSAMSSFNKEKEHCLMQLVHCITANPKYRKARTRQAIISGSVNSVSKIDKFSRILFPLTFSLFNVFYWLFYREGHEFKWKPVPYY
ncbi:gamma-aminobutyric acid receptor alpha-like isoform X2 [Artemia franciscana]|uniref:gamma-aminobutyric acid receptor alpha-like isoform X2 n=1 Tax=Artemia franciscana TaxID=6661 RepID=UPI0032D9BE10